MTHNWEKSCELFFNEKRAHWKSGIWRQTWGVVLRPVWGFIEVPLLSVALFASFPEVVFAFDRQ